MMTYLSPEKLSEIAEQKSCGPQHEQQYIAEEIPRNIVVNIVFISSNLLS